MKNYTYSWRLKELGYIEVPEEEYTQAQNDMKEYIKLGIGFYLGYTVAQCIDKNLGGVTEKGINIVKDFVNKIK